MNGNLSKRIVEIRQRIAESAIKSGRDASEITLVAVSKTHPVALIEEALQSGLRVFGENKVKEADNKIVAIDDRSAEWHLIGHLQSNKVRRAVKIFDVIQTVDSIELAERLERIAIEEGRADFKIFAQVDLGGEATKSGISEAELSRLLEFVKGCQCLKLLGLMQIPPFYANAELTRPFFRRLREIRDMVLPDGALSMGMSHDFEVAIEEGATHVRIGTAIFGARDYT